MNLAHLHLLLNHAPVIGVVFGLGLLAYGLWRRSDELKKAALGIFVIVALLSIPAYLTGEPAEDVAKPLPGVSSVIMEKHENAAAIAFAGAVFIGTAALAGLILCRRGKALPPWLGFSMLGASLVVGGLMAWTANLGGQVRHTEIRSNATVSPQSGGERHHD